MPLALFAFRCLFEEGLTIYAWASLDHTLPISAFHSAGISRHSPHNQLLLVEMGVVWTFCLGWSQIAILPISASRIIGMSHCTWLKFFFWFPFDSLVVQRHVVLFLYIFSFSNIFFYYWLIVLYHYSQKNYLIWFQSSSTCYDLFCGIAYGTLWKNIPRALRRVHILLLLDDMLCMFVRSLWSKA
jgi:hypothetical protein